MPRPGSKSVTLTDDLIAALRRVAPHAGLVDDGRRRNTPALVIRRLLEHYVACTSTRYVPPLEVYDQGAPR